MFRDAIRSRYFFGVTLAYAFVLLAQVGAIAHVFKLVTVRADASLAATAVALMAACSMCARLLGGWLVTLITQRLVALIMMLVQGLALLALASSETPTGLLLAVAAFGVSIGNILMLLPLLLAEAFGVRHFSRIFSVSQLVTTLGVACGPLLLGIVHDFGSGYRDAYWMAGLASIIAFFILMAAGKPARMMGVVQSSST